MFSSEFCEILKNTLFTEYLWALTNIDHAEQYWLTFLFISIIFVILKIDAKSNNFKGLDLQFKV